MPVFCECFFHLFHFSLLFVDICWLHLLINLIVWLVVRFPFCSFICFSLLFYIKLLIYSSIIRGWGFTFATFVIVILVQLLLRLGNLFIESAFRVISSIHFYAIHSLVSRFLVLFSFSTHFSNGFSISLGVRSHFSI
jgi:hypothetical protein